MAIRLEASDCTILVVNSAKFFVQFATADLAEWLPQLAKKLCLPIIGRLPGHTQPQTTARYAHLAVTPSLEVADKISESLAHCIEWKEAS
jgi:hypothetical protein